MNKHFFLLILGIVLSAVAMGSYSYTVSGNVYHSATGTPVSSAVVTHEIEWAPGMWSSSSLFTAEDGSFTFSPTADSDFKGKNMRLKASKNFLAGSTTWTCASYSESKNVWISSTIQINPDLVVQLNPSNFASAGIQPPLTVAAYLDNPAPIAMEISGFYVQLAYDPTKMNCNGIGPADPRIMVNFNLQEGMIEVWGEAMTPFPILFKESPTSFFDVFFDVFAPADPAITSVILGEKTTLYPFPPTGQEGMMPCPSRTDILIGEPVKAQAGVYINGFGEWSRALEGQSPDPGIRPMSMTQWEEYMMYWNNPDSEKEGDPYPKTTFVPCDNEYGSGLLYVWPGDPANGAGGSGGMQDAGLVMAWMPSERPWESGEYASAWRFDYGWDPDLTNCTIQVTVTPPAPPAGSPSRINAVSFSIVDIAGRMRTWWWAVPAAIPLGVPTTVTINTAMVGINAATPVATGYMNAPGFDLTRSQFFDVDENFQYVFGQQPVPPPGQQQFMAWNYWHWLRVTKNTQPRKWFYIKYGQPPVAIGDANPPLIRGWDEPSVYWPPQYPIIADDWPCKDDRPITDIHWWGSFVGWTKPYLPKVLPKAFHIGIWTDVPVGPNVQFSHPGKLIWENVCTSWVWNFAGYDVDPRCNYPDMTCQKDEACFQFTQLLSENEWFHQKPLTDPAVPNIYWLSIAAIYPQTPDGVQPAYPWGWKTRPHKFNDDAVRIANTDIWPIKLGANYLNGIPIQLPPWPVADGQSWDMAFELSTNKPTIPASADLNYSGFVDLADFALFAQQWLTSQP